MSIDELFPGFKVAPTDPSRELKQRPALTVFQQPPDDDDDRGWEDYDDSPCGQCYDGMLVVCVDDLCRGAGYCMHGDGERLCPNCHGR